MNDPEQATLRIGDDGEIKGGLPVPERKAKRKGLSRLARATRRTTVVGFWTIFILLGGLGGVTGVLLFRTAANAPSVPCIPSINYLSAGNNKLLAQVGYAWRQNQYDAQLMNFDGSDSKRLEGDFQSRLDYSISPDGAFFVDAKYEDNTGKVELYITDLKTNTRRHLRSGISISWASDSRRVAFVDRGGIFTMDIGGANLKLVGDSANVNYPPAWSPDGKTLAITVNEVRATVIYLLDLDTSRRSVLLKNGQYNDSVAWSPDGKYLTYHSNQDIYVISSDGSTGINVTKGNFDDVRHPVWSSDGKQIAFIGFRRPHQSAIYVTNLDGTDVRSIYTPSCG
jgi:Tol biopolymer transport system component